mmetsp:Transcript_718/g.2287  ORF Transcript_718/g.2287 Transcript_718/m.2287 type:complete len:953 (+) Transcript_718:350-3208(+)
MRVLLVRDREHGVHVVRGLEALPVLHVGPAQGHAGLGDVPRVRVHAHAVPGLRGRREDLRLRRLPLTVAGADDVGHACLPGHLVHLRVVDRDLARAAHAAPAHHADARRLAQAGLLAATCRGRRRRVRAPGVGAAEVGLLVGLVLLVPLHQLLVPGVHLVLDGAAVLDAALVVHCLDRLLHVVHDVAIVHGVVARELPDVDRARVLLVELAEDRVDVRGGVGDLELLAGRAEIGQREVSVVVDVELLEHPRGLQLPAVRILHLRDGVAHGLHEVARLPVVLVARDLLVRGPLPWRAVTAQVARHAVVDPLDRLPLVVGLVHVLDERLDVDLVVPVHPLRGDVGLDVRRHQLQARGRGLWALSGQGAVATDGSAEVHPRPHRVARLVRELVGAQRQHVDLAGHVRRVDRLLRRPRGLHLRVRELVAEHREELVLVDHLAFFQELLHARLRDALRHRALDALGLAADLLRVGLRQHGHLAHPVRQRDRAVHHLVGDDGDAVRRVLVGPVQVHVAEVPPGERRRALQEVVLALPALHAARRGGAVVLGEVRQLAHEAAPVDAMVLDVAVLLARELRGPEEVDGLVRDVVGGGAQGVRELMLADLVAALRVQLAKGLAQELSVADQVVNQRLRDVPHVPLLRLVRPSADVHARAVDEVGELLEAAGALDVLVHRLHEHGALVLGHLDAHLVEDGLEVLREDEAGLGLAAAPEDADEARSACVALLYHLAKPLHPHHRVRVLRRRVVEVRQVRGPDLEVVAGLLVRRVDGAAARVVLVLVVVEGVAVLGVRLGRRDVLRPPHAAEHAVLALDMAAGFLRLHVVPGLALLLHQRRLRLGRSLVPALGVPARRGLEPLLLLVPLLIHDELRGPDAARRHGLGQPRGLHFPLLRLEMEHLALPHVCPRVLPRLPGQLVLEVHVADAHGGGEGHVGVHLVRHLARLRRPRRGVEVDRHASR